LFTTFDYKRLLDSVETHFRLQLIAQDLRPITVSAFYNTGKAKGCVIFHALEENPMFEISKMEFPNGNDILTVYFDTN